MIPRLGLDRHLAVRAIGGSDTGEEQADEMMDLGHGGHGALAAAARIALLDADGGRNSSDQIHIRPGELLDELPGIGAHGIEKPALAFGEQQVEGERAFA